MFQLISQESRHAKNGNKQRRWSLEGNLLCWPFPRDESRKCEVFAASGNPDTSSRSIFSNRYVNCAMAWQSSMSHSLQRVTPQSDQMHRCAEPCNSLRNPLLLKATLTFLHFKRSALTIMAKKYQATIFSGPQINSNAVSVQSSPHMDTNVRLGRAAIFNLMISCLTGIRTQVLCRNFQWTQTYILQRRLSKILFRQRSTTKFTFVVVNF